MQCRCARMYCSGVPGVLCEGWDGKAPMARATALAVCAQASTGAGNAIARGLAHRHLCAAPDF
eukprot:1746932-Pyramimonas_sp.AAC.1